MNARRLHVDEISVWAWVATLAFFLTALAAATLTIHDKSNIASTIVIPVLPFTAPAVLPQGLTTDGRA